MLREDAFASDRMRLWGSGWWRDVALSVVMATAMENSTHVESGFIRIMALRLGGTAYPLGPRLVQNSVPRPFAFSWTWHHDAWNIDLEIQEGREERAMREQLLTKPSPRALHVRVIHETTDRPS